MSDKCANEDCKRLTNATFCAVCEKRLLAVVPQAKPKKPRKPRKKKL